jgi:hypothetical protein
MYRNFIINNKTLVSIFLFLILFTLILLGKPRFLYNSNGTLRDFGIGYKNKTILPVWLFAIVLAILCYIFVMYYSLNFRIFHF